MSEMVDRAKSAILRVNESTVGLPFSKLVELMARAVILDMREPTEAMVEAAKSEDDPGGMFGSFGPRTHDDAWRAMIDEALK